MPLQNELPASPTMQYRSLKEDSVTDGNCQHGKLDCGKKAETKDHCHGDGNDSRTLKTKSNNDTSALLGLYLNRFMDPKVIAKSLLDAATTKTTTATPDSSNASSSHANATSITSEASGNVDDEAVGKIISETRDEEKRDGDGEESDTAASNVDCETDLETSNELSDVRQLIVDGVDLENDSIRNALIHLFESCDHDWHCIEFKGCLGPLDTILRVLLLHAATPVPKSTLCSTHYSSLSGIVDSEESLQIEEECKGKQASSTVLKQRIRRIHQLRLIGVTMDDDLTGAIADGLSVNGGSSSSEESSSKQSDTSTIRKTREIATKTSYHVRKLMISGTKVMGVNVVALRHGWNGTNASRSPSLESLDSTPSSTRLVAKKIAGVTGLDWDSCRSDNHCGFLTKLDLFSCDLSDELVAMLLKRIQGGRHPIQELDLGKNQCVLQGLRAIDDLLCDEHSTIKWLNLFYQLQHQNQVNRDGTARNGDEQHTVRSQGQQQQQQRQQQQQQQQSDMLDVSLISKGLAINKSLVTLILRGNKLSDECVNSLASAVQQNSTLQKLNLTDCCISRKAIQSLIPKVLGNPISASSSQSQIVKSSTSSISSSTSFSKIQNLWLDGGQLFGHGGSGGRMAARKEVLAWFQTALQCNHLLEELYLPFGYFEDRKNSNQITHLLDLNRGGRKLITTALLPSLGVATTTEAATKTSAGGDDKCNNEADTVEYQKYHHHHIPIALWPHVLERVNKMPLFMSGLRHQHKNDEEQSNVGCRRISVTYTLLRSHVLLQS